MHDTWKWTKQEESRLWLQWSNKSNRKLNTGQELSSGRQQNIFFALVLTG
jgi:hypothetical protein